MPLFDYFNVQLHLLCVVGKKKKKKNLMAHFYGVQLPQGYSHFDEAVYFLPFSSKVSFITFCFFSLLS